MKEINSATIYHLNKENYTMLTTHKKASKRNSFDLFGFANFYFVSCIRF